MKKIFLIALSLMTIIACCSCGNSNVSDTYKTPLEIVSELTEIEEGTELSQLEEMDLLNLSSIGINAEEYSYKGRLDAPMHGDYWLIDGEERPFTVRYEYVNWLNQSILVDKYGRLLETKLNDSSRVSSLKLSDDELIEISSDCAKRALGDKFQGYSVQKITRSNYGTSLSICWRKEGKERFADLIVIELTDRGFIYRIGINYSDLPDNYSYQEIDEIAEKWFEENLTKLYPETSSYVVDKYSVENIDGKVYADYVATINVANYGGSSCVELIVQDMTVNEKIR